MKKEYSFKSTENPSMVNEPTVVYSTPHRVHFDVTIEDDSMISEVKRALQMIKGVTSVTLSSVSDKNVVSSDPFEELDTTWGGDRDANDIAEELHSMRNNSRTVETW